MDRNIERKVHKHMQTLIGAGIASFFIYAAAKWNPTEQAKIKHLFKNIKYKVGDQLPILKKIDKNDTYTRYIYSVPYGLIDDPKLKNTLEKTLGKKVDVSFNRMLFIKVYHQTLPTNIKYDWQSTKKWTVPIGKAHDNFIYHNFDKIPHMTIAGMTRQGKTVLLKLILAHLINNNKHVEFYILDLKGGLEFGRYDKLKQVKNVSSNVSEAVSQLKIISKQLKSYMVHFKNNGYNNIVNTNIKKRTFIIVDEAAELDKECQKYLAEIARVGGALGYRLIFATQYPTSDTLPRQIKQNSDAKITFRLPTEFASRVAIDEQGAEDLTCPGRAIYRTHERVEMQVPYISDTDIEKQLRRYEVDTTKEKGEARGTDTFTLE